MIFIPSLNPKIDLSAFFRNAEPVMGLRRLQEDKAGSWAALGPLWTVLGGRFGSFGGRFVDSIHRFDSLIQLVASSTAYRLNNSARRNARSD